MAETHSPWPEFGLLDLLLEREGMARSPDVWFYIHAILLSRIFSNQELSTPSALASLIGPLVCKSPQHQQRMESVIREWLTGEKSDKTTLIPASSRSTSTPSYTLLRRFKKNYILATLALLGLLFFIIRAELFQQSEVTQPPPTPATSQPSPKSIPKTEATNSIPITNSVKPNTLPMPVEPMHQHFIYSTLVFGLPLLGCLLYLIWRYLPQIILRKQQQDDDQRLIGLQIKDFQHNPDIPFSGSKRAADLSPLLRPLWTTTRQLHVADTVATTANNFGFFTPVYRQRIQRPEYVILVQSLHGYDQIADVADLFIQALNQNSKHIQIRGYRFRDDPRRLHPIASAQPKDDADTLPMSLLQLAKQRGDARLIVISDWDIAYVPYQSHQPQDWLKQLDDFEKRVWLCPGHDSPEWAERAKTQAQRLNMRLLPLSSVNIPNIARWLSQDHNPLAPLGHTGDEPLPPSLMETAESWLSWRPPHGIDLKQLLNELRDYLGQEGLLLLQAMAVFPKPVWPLPYVLDKQLFSGKTQKKRKLWLPWRHQSNAEVEQSQDSQAKEQRLINIGRLPWSRHAYMPDYMRELLLKALSRAERKRIRLAWQVILDKIAINPSADKIDIPIAATPTSKIELQHFLQRQEQENALDDAIFANILLGGKLGLLDFKLPKAISGVLPGAAKLLDVRPALTALILTGLGIWGFNAAWHTYGKTALSHLSENLKATENASWQVDIFSQSDTLMLANQFIKALITAKFPTQLNNNGFDPQGALKHNIINYAPGGGAVAQRVANSLAWVSYGATVTVSQDVSLPANTLKVFLKQTYQHTAGFNDRLNQPYQQAKQEMELNLKSYPIEPDMVTIKPGKFLMGSDEKEPGRDSDEGPQHEVNINYSFEIGKMEVTFAEYDRFADATGREKPNDMKWGRGNQPVINVSFTDAQAYVQWLSQQTGKVYRLPTEAEWEYIAKAGSTTAYWWGNDIGNNRANCIGCSSQWDKKQTAPVSSFKANTFGLFNTVGNVWEWTQDCGHLSYDNAPTDGTAWLEQTGGDCDRRMVRGGSWNNGPLALRSAVRLKITTGGVYTDLGFRVARVL
jgi:formylglycine-generating enzyme required for sulfatase activity